MGAQASPELLGISHQHGQRRCRPRSPRRSRQAARRPPISRADEQHAWDQLDFFYKNGPRLRERDGAPPADAVRASRTRRSASRRGSSTTTMRATQLIARVFDGKPAGLTRDDILDNITHVLADEHRGVVRTSVLGQRADVDGRVLRRQGGPAPGLRHGLPRRDLCRAAALGGAGVPEPHPVRPPSPWAATSPPGSNPGFSRRTSARASVRSAANDGAGR